MNLKRMAKKIDKIAIEIESIIANDFGFSKFLEHRKEDILDIEQEIKEIIASKLANDSADEKLVQLFGSAGEIISTTTSIKQSSINKTYSEKEKQTLRAIRDTIMRILRGLDSFYKTNLNPKFNYHGITHVMLDDRMNELKQAYKDITKLC